MQTCNFQQNHQTPSVQSSAVNIYASYLRSLYTKMKLQGYDKWPQLKSKKYINLAFIEKDNITKPEADQFTRDTIHGNIDDINKSKQAIEIGQIAQLPDGSQPKCILVEGAPGVGKSTFAWKLCHKWGKRKLLQQYELVVLLRLRDKNVRAATNISDLFRYHDHEIQHAVVDEIQDTRGKGVLLLIEGYDELPEELRAGSSVFLDVITGKELPMATVLITSRPWASEFLHRECAESISQHIEILGFTKANIQSYLESTTANNPSLLTGLEKYISCYPHIGSLMYIPLNSAIVIEVYRNCRKDDTVVPKTMTELYSSLVRSLLLRHLLEHPVHGKNRRWRVRTFDGLPSDVYQQLCELGRIAYEGILHDQKVIFPIEDLPEDFETLGLMQSATELYVDEGPAVSCNFLHLTIQEYLAAFHLLQQPVEKQIEHFSEYKAGRQPLRQQQQNHFCMILRFLCGLRKFHGYPSEVLNTLCVKKSGDDSTNVVPFNTLHWLFEAQDNGVIANVLGSSNTRSPNGHRTGTPFDCFVLGYCVSHSNCAWSIDLEYCNIGNEGVEMLVRGAMEEKTHCTGGFSEIDLCMNHITSEGVKHLLDFPKQFISKLKKLDLSENKLDSESCQALSELLSSSTSLKILSIGDNDLPPEAVELIISELHHNTTLEMLFMNDSHFSHQNIISLASVLRTNHTLVDLNLAECHIDSDGACQLASALCTNDTLNVLIMGDNPIGVEGAAAVAKMLCKNKSLKQLYLQDDSIGEEGTQKLIDSLIHNTTLEQLYLPLEYKSSIASSRVDSRVDFTDAVVLYY